MIKLYFMDSLKCALYFYAIGELIVNDHQPFELVTNYEPAGDQPQAIAKLVDGVNKGFHDQLLLGQGNLRQRMYGLP